MKIFNTLWAMVILGLMLSAPAMAQDEEITDSDLHKYALLSEVIDLMKKDISIELNGMIKNQEGMTGTRYKELAATKGDEAKLAEIEAKEFEIQFIGLFDDLKSKRTVAIKTVNQELATKMVGNKGKTYKAIKAALKENADLKARYDQVLASIRMENQ